MEVTYGVIFHGILDEEVRPELTKYIMSINGVKDVSYDVITLENEDEKLDCTIAVITMDGLGIMFKFDWEMLFGTKLIRTEDSPFVYFHAVD